MAKKIAKTNAMRILDGHKIEYVVREYPSDGPVSAKDLADYLDQPKDKLFKTLVTTDGTHGYYVFCVPGDHELDLKKAAKEVGVKKIEMLKQKDLLGLTGYVHGGCSPIGMKKVFPTTLDTTSMNWDTIFVSGGKIGLQIEFNPRDLEKIMPVKIADILKED